MAYLLILGSFSQKRLPAWTLLVCPLLMMAWVNLHGAFILGGVMVGIFFVGEALRTLLHGENALTWRQVGWIAPPASLPDWRCW